MDIKEKIYKENAEYAREHCTFDEIVNMYARSCVNAFELAEENMMLKGMVGSLEHQIKEMQR